MDSRSNLFNQVIWDIGLGDLVKIKNYNYSGKLYYHYGIVVGNPEECQIDLFPFVNVFNFSTRQEQKCYPNSLEIVSRLTL